jgi:putative endonuclease
VGRENKIIGKIGEDIAIAFLRQKGYKVLGVNVRTHLGEIDIIAKQKDVTVFVEVKTRASSSLGPPYLNVTPLKKKHLAKNALCYMKRHGRIHSSWRVDVVSVKLNMYYKMESIELIENAVEENY